MTVTILNHGEHFLMYITDESLSSSEANITLYIKYILIKINNF